MSTVSPRIVTPLAGDILLFAPDAQSHSMLGYALEKAITFGERLEHPDFRGPFFSHCGIMLSSSTFAQENGIAGEATLADIPSSQELWLKRLALTPRQRLDIPDAARALYGIRYDYMLDVYLGMRYAWQGIANGIRHLTYDAISLPASHIGQEEHHRLICSTFDRAVLESVGFKVRKRYPSPEHYALMPGPIWRIQ